jgi:type IV pilus assembly protein PilB
MYVSERELIEFLIDTGLVSKRALEEAQNEAAKLSIPFEQVVIDKGLISLQDLRRAEAHVAGIPYVDLTRVLFDLATLSHVPEPVAREHNAVAIGRDGDVLKVAFLNLESLPKVKFIEEAHGVRISPRLTDRSSIKHALVSYRNALREEFGSIIEEESRNLDDIKKDRGLLTEAELHSYAESPSVARILRAILSQAILSRATNIHIDTGASDTRVRFRYGGALYDAAVLPKHLGLRLLLRIKHLAGLNHHDEMPQDGKFTVDTEAGETTFRVRTTPTHHGEKIMMRVLTGGTSGFTLESLGLTGRTLEHVERALHKREGLVLACSKPSGGKSTFLYTALDIVNHPERSIHTVEDPIEYIMPRVEQTQVDESNGLTTARALRAAALTDADVLMVSEVRDGETSRTAVAAGLSGELVLAGVEAGSAAEGIVKLMELGTDKKLLSSALSLSIGMAVVKRLGNSREKYHLNQSELKSLGKLVPMEPLLETLKAEGLVPMDATWDQVPFWKPSRVQWAGREFFGRVGLFEVVKMTPRLRELVMNGASRTSITEEARISGNLSLLEDGIMKAVAGLTTLEEVLRAVSL